MKDFELSERKRQLLLNAVESYIENALPITSEKVQTNYFQKLSSATLRNELNTLEEMGFLKQLHTSGGRIPTTKAYRYFVNNLITSKDFNLEAIAKIEDKFVKRSSFLLEVLEELAAKISTIVNYPTFVQLKNYDSIILEGINFIPLITDDILVLLQTNAGILNNTISLQSAISEENCKDASKFLTQNLANKSVVEILENFDYYNNLFKSQLKYFQELFFSLTDMLKNFTVQKASFLKHGNTTKLLKDFENKDINNAKKFLNFIENEDKIKNIIQNIDDNTQSDVVFSIGEENTIDDNADYSIVKANYSLANGIVATVGVVGPERMDYAKVASILKYIADEMPRDDNKNNKETGGSDAKKRKKDKK